MVSNGYLDSILAFVLLAASGALHFVRYHFRHGRGRDRHERETESRIRRQLQQSASEDAAEQEVLIRLQQDHKLKNRRLVWQHLTLFVSVISLMFLLPLSDMTIDELLDWSNWQSLATFTGVWGIGLAAHFLRYLFAYRVSSGRREAKIEEQLMRELRRERRQRLSPTLSSGEDLVAEKTGRARHGQSNAAGSVADGTSIEELLQGRSTAKREGRP